MTIHDRFVRDGVGMHGWFRWASITLFLVLKGVGCAGTPEDRVDNTVSSRDQRGAHPENTGVPPVLEVVTTLGDEVRMRVASYIATSESGPGARAHALVVGANYHPLEGCADNEVLRIVDAMPGRSIPHVSITFLEQTLNLKRGFALSCSAHNLAEANIHEPRFLDPTTGRLYLRTGTIDASGSLQNEFYALTPDEPYVFSENDSGLFHTSLFKSHRRHTQPWVGDGATVINVAFGHDPSLRYRLEFAKAVNVGGAGTQDFFYYYRLRYYGEQGTTFDLRIGRINGNFVSPQGDRARVISYLSNALGISIDPATVTLTTDELGVEGEEPPQNHKPYLDLCMSCTGTAEAPTCNACAQPGTRNHFVLASDVGSRMLRGLEPSETTLLRDQDLKASPYLSWRVAGQTHYFRGCERLIGGAGLSVAEENDGTWQQRRRWMAQALDDAGTMPFDNAFTCRETPTVCVRQLDSETVTSSTLRAWISNVDGLCPLAINGTDTPERHLEIRVLRDVGVDMYAAVYLTSLSPFDRVTIVGHRANSVLTLRTSEVCGAADTEFPWLCAHAPADYLVVRDGKELRLQNLLLRGVRHPAMPMTELVKKHTLVNLDGATLRLSRARVGESLDESSDALTYRGIVAKDSVVAADRSSVFGLAAALDLRGAATRSRVIFADAADSTNALTRIESAKSALALSLDTDVFLYRAQVVSPRLALLGGSAHLNLWRTSYHHANQHRPDTYVPVGMIEMSGSTTEPEYKFYAYESDFVGLSFESSQSALWVQNSDPISRGVFFDQSRIFVESGGAAVTDEAALRQTLTCSGHADAALWFSAFEGSESLFLNTCASPVF